MAKSPIKYSQKGRIMFGYKREITEIKASINYIRQSLNEVHCKLFQRSPQCKCKSACIKGCGVQTEENEGESSQLEDLTAVITDMKEMLDDVFDPIQENSSINRIHEKLDEILKDEKRLEKVQFGLAACEKFDDYLKNVDKLNAMVNEIKGIAAMTRANLQQKKSAKKKASSNASSK